MVAKDKLVKAYNSINKTVQDEDSEEKFENDASDSDLNFDSGSD